MSFIPTYYDVLFVIRGRDSYKTYSILVFLTEELDEIPKSMVPRQKDGLALFARTRLHDGESELEFVERTTAAIWEGNGDYCTVEVMMMDENERTEMYRPTRESYDITVGKENPHAHPW